MCKGVACDQYHLKGKRCYKIEVMIAAILFV